MKKKLSCILLIDDDEPTNFLNRLTLEEAECVEHIQVLESGQEALDYLAGKGNYDGSLGSFPIPELIFLDINMPAMDGWEFLEKYQQLPAQRKAAIIMIMLTTSLNPDDELRTQVIPEVSGFENKPLMPGRLQDILLKHFPDRVGQ